MLSTMAHVSLFLIFYCIMPLFVHAENNDHSVRLAWEQEMALRVKKALIKYLGPDRAEVFIKADIDVKQSLTQKHDYSLNPQAASDPKQAGDVSWLWSNIGANESKDSYILPELKSPPNMQRKPISPLKGNDFTEQTTFLPQINVKKLYAVVIVDAKTSEDSLTTVNNVIKIILEIDEARGDRVEIVRLPFVPAWKKAVFSSSMLMDVIRWLAIVISLAIVGFFIYRGLRGIGNSVSQAISTRLNTHEIDMNLNARGQAAIGTMEIPGQQQSLQSLAWKKTAPQNTQQYTGNMLEHTKPFSFINGNKPENIVKALENEDAETIVLVLSCLDSQRTTSILSLLPKDKQGDVALALAKTDFVDNVKVKTIEEKLKSKLESLVEGKEQIIDILSRTNNNLRETILSYMKEKEPELAEKLQNIIFKFEDIAKLGPGEINLVLAGISHEELSIALRGIEPDVIDTITQALPKEAQKVLKQWIDIGQPQSATRADEIRGKIANTARELEREGRISRSIFPKKVDF